MQKEVQKLNKQYKDMETTEFIKRFLNEYKGKISFSSSFGAEDQVLTDILVTNKKSISIFTLDTGRLPYETYDLMHKVNEKYKINVDVYFPKNVNVQNLYKDQGINGFYDSVQNRKECCAIRKLEPLHRALEGVDVWITGLRAQQSVTRKDLELFEWDDGLKIIKLNPLIAWSEEEIWEYIKRNKLPYNKLHDEGFPSIGCAPCTRAVEAGDDVRSGRWWWEEPEHKECGLHIKDQT